MRRNLLDAMPPLPMRLALAVKRRDKLQQIIDAKPADAILDRIIHRAHRNDLKGPSLRRRLVASESPAA
jgi:hypothetical protein